MNSVLIAMRNAGSSVMPNLASAEPIVIMIAVNVSAQTIGIHVSASVFEKPTGAFVRPTIVATHVADAL